VFVTAQGSAGTRFERAVRSRNLFLAETAAFEMGTLTLKDALALIVLYAEAEGRQVREGRRQVAGPVAARAADAARGRSGRSRARRKPARPWGGVVGSSARDG
jgi:hypothetical protein